MCTANSVDTGRGTFTSKFYWVPQIVLLFIKSVFFIITLVYELSRNANSIMFMLNYIPWYQHLVGNIYIFQTLSKLLNVKKFMNWIPCESYEFLSTMVQSVKFSASLIKSDNNKITFFQLPLPYIHIIPFNHTTYIEISPYTLKTFI